MTNQDDLQGIEHLDHCVDILRQGLMVCWSSLPPIMYRKSFPCKLTAINNGYSAVVTLPL
jgi:hypothetical protein